MGKILRAVRIYTVNEVIADIIVDCTNVYSKMIERFGEDYVKNYLKAGIYDVDYILANCENYFLFDFLVANEELHVLLNSIKEDGVYISVKYLN